MASLAQQWAKANKSKPTDFNLTKLHTFRVTRTGDLELTMLSSEEGRSYTAVYPTAAGIPLALRDWLTKYFDETETVKVEEEPERGSMVFDWKEIHPGQPKDNL